MATRKIAKLTKPGDRKLGDLTDAELDAPDNFEAAQPTTGADVSVSSNAARQAEHRRNYRRLRKKVWETASDCHDMDNSISCNIFSLVRERFGCRATEIDDRNIEAALAFVGRLRRLAFNVMISSEMNWGAARPREQQPSNGHGEWFNNLVREMQEIADRPCGTPALRLIPDCGRDLA